MIASPVVEQYTSYADRDDWEFRYMYMAQMYPSPAAGLQAMLY
jgi:hypothetical protein